MMAAHEYSNVSGTGVTLDVVLCPYRASMLYLHFYNKAHFGARAK